jgi:hypothetical protein
MFPQPVWRAVESPVVFTVGSYAGPVVKTFITTGLSPNFTAPAFDSTMKLITADSQKNGGESPGSDNTIYSSD